MKAIRYLGIDKIGVEEVEKPQVSKGWALIKTAYAGVCGSDMTIYHGRRGPKLHSPWDMSFPDTYAPPAAFLREPS